jgi:light-regulated signal transduction histidine kinase (bacteriophytochrome)
VATDITEPKRAANAQQKLLAELARSNTDLEQFAYVASHDLQEPLRNVKSYTQLLARRYKGKLDTEADEFMHYIVEGTTRMQNLILDLLEYSRITSRGQPLRQSMPMTRSMTPPIGPSG